MQNINTKLTFFVNKASNNYFLLDTKGKSLQAVSHNDVLTLDKYKHMMGFEGNYRTFDIPNYDTMKKFQKLVKTLDFSQIEGDHAKHLVDHYPEFFL